KVNPPGQKITFVRHGESEGNVKNVISGQTDHQLTELGRKQASEIAWEAVVQYDLMITSTLSRAKETGKIIAEKLGIKEIVDNELVNERDFGDLENLNKDQIKETYPEFKQVWQEEVPNGETIREME